MRRAPLLSEWPFINVHQLFCNVELQKNVSVFGCLQMYSMLEMKSGGCQIQIQVNYNNSWLTII